MAIARRHSGRVRRGRGQIEPTRGHDLLGLHVPTPSQQEREPLGTEESAEELEDIQVLALGPQRVDA
eukprot:95486-Pyramimonas_sp.AAC.1